jgi:hypothetical protein
MVEEVWENGPIPGPIAIYRLSASPVPRSWDETHLVMGGDSETITPAEGKITIKVSASPASLRICHRASLVRWPCKSPCRPPYKRFPYRPFDGSEIDGQWGWVVSIHTPRWRVQRIPAGGREVPSPQTGKVIEASPLDPAANLAGALRAPSDRRSLGVVSWPEISKQFQKFALILRRTFPRHAPHRISDHIPQSPFPDRNIARNRCRNKAYADSATS